MKRTCLFLLSVPILLALASSAVAQGTAFTYQGRLSDGGPAANGIYDLRFAIYDALTGGSAVSSVLTNAVTGVSNGFFTVALDFGAPAFNGAERWLQIGVRPNGSAADFTALAPRQPITATPYAMMAGNVTGNGAGLNNVNARTLGGLASSAFWQLDGNSGTTPGLHFLGTTDNRPMLIRAGFLGIGRTTPITGAEYFGIRAPVTNRFGGMYVETAGPGLPFYGYAMAGGLSAFHYVDGNDANKWKLSVGGAQLTVAPDGNVGIGTTFPSTRLHVAGQVRITGGSPGDGKLLMSDANGVASWRSPSELSVFFGQNYSVLLPDVINNTTDIEIEGITTGDFVIVNGPGLQIERIPGFTGTRPFDRPGPNMEYPFVFECDGPATNALRNWHQNFTNDPAANRRAMSVIIRRLDGLEAGRWNLFEMGLTEIGPGADGRHRYTLQHGLPPNNTFHYERDLITPAEASKNPATDLYRIEIEGIFAGSYPNTQIDYTNRTITLIFDYVEAGGVYNWVRNTAAGTEFKRAMSVITEANGVEVSRRNFFEVFPISFQQTTGFGQVEKLKEKVVLSFDFWEDG